MTTLENLHRFYNFSGSFFILVQRDGSLVIEKGNVEDGIQKETILRIFMTIEDAVFYRNKSMDRINDRVMKVTLVGLWSLLGKVNDFSNKEFNLPVRVDVSSISDIGLPVSIDILHSAYSLHS